MIERLTRAGLKVVPTGLAHGTVTAVLPRRAIEITTLRRDVETDGRHAVVAFTDDWREDAARRDFTINAMSMARDGTVFDYFGGTDDLRAGRLRFVGDPAARVAEDYLRVLRFFRFFARYGGAEPDAATPDGIARCGASSGSAVGRAGVERTFSNSVGTRSDRFHHDDAAIGRARRRDAARVRRFGIVPVGGARSTGGWGRYGSRRC